MDTITALADKLLDGRLSAKIKAFLNVVLVGSVTSATFKCAYFEYDILAFDDHKGYYQFFINGDFLVPAFLFYVLWWGTDLFAKVLFTILSIRVVRKYQRRIEAYVVKKFTGIDSYEMETKERLVLFIKATKADWIHELLRQTNQSISSTEYARLLSKRRSAQLQFERDFVLLFRVFLAATVYFNTIPHFGHLLYGALILVIAINGLLLLVAYRIADIIPRIVNNLGSILEALEIKD
ncbi:hypothetical protein KK062_21120 [Fulvivirgaceae bacterium PWU5]|uniref:Uncharacterized protein n=1 Tax=Dawidia cretensis TaxID=2782350 RepID=A0AAP2GRH2_9BACT|nr:hypothetical protein [Dawidia cretensis]MBT1710756.1 hypothetical protein [Dawidia cretensis]